MLRARGDRDEAMRLFDQAPQKSIARICGESLQATANPPGGSGSGRLQSILVFSA
jgi:hypothetical protein